MTSTHPIESRIPVSVVSGFLGSGKTTLLRHMLPVLHTRGERVVVIENEFGQAGLDGDLLRETGTEVRDLVSGCICCTLKGDFADALQSLAAEYKPDRILIEPSGIFVPTEVLSIFRDPAIDAICRIASITTIVDARHFLKQQKKYAQFLEVQAGYASSLVMSKTDGIDDEDLTILEEILHGLNPFADVWSVSWDELAPEDLLHLLEPPTSATAAYRDEFPQVHGQSETAPAASAFHHAAFSSLTLCGHKPFARSLLESKLRLLSTGGFGQILRAKGTVPTLTEEEHLRFEYVAGDFEIERISGRTDLEPVLVVIGEGLDKPKLRALFA